MHVRKRYTDKEKKEFISAIKRGGQRGNQAMETIYKDYNYKNYLYQLLAEYGLSHTEVQDFFHDAMLIFRKNCRTGKFDRSKDIQVYITSIVKNLVKNSKKLSRYNREILTEQNSGVEESVAEYYSRVELRENLRKLLSHLSPECEKILTLWQEDYSYSEIAKKLKLRDGAKARKNKFLCMTKLAEKLVDFPQLRKMI